MMITGLNVHYRRAAMPDPCNCNAYSYPHRQGGGDCPGGEYCHHCGEPFVEADYVEKFPETRETPAEGVSYCPLCGKELEE